MMDRLTLLRALVRIVDLGTLTAAARELQVGQSTVSKWLAALEAEVGVPLLDRTTRTLRPTDAGEVLLRHARGLVEGWDDAMAEVQAHAPRIEGRLRVSIPSVFGTRHVVPHLGTFLDRYPALRLDLFLADRYVQLLDEGLDVAVRVGVAVPSSNRAIALGGGPRRLVASPCYLADRGWPVDPGALSTHDGILHTGIPRGIWTASRGSETASVRVGGRVQVDHSEAARQLAVQGLGIALLASWLVDEDVAEGRLVALLPDWRFPSAPIRALLPPARHVPPRVRVFLDHLRAAWRDGLAPVG